MMIWSAGLVCTSELKPWLDFLETKKKHNNITLCAPCVPIGASKFAGNMSGQPYHTMSAQMSSFAISYSEDASLTEIDDAAMTFWTTSIAMIARTVFLYAEAAADGPLSPSEMDIAVSVALMGFAKIKKLIDSY